MLLQIFSKVLIVADYQANKEYIMAFLCINRDKPELQCEGKCHLSKKLKAQHESDKKTDERGQKQEVQVNLYCQNLFNFPNPKPATIVTTQVNYNCSYTSVAYHSIFHPPRLIV